MHGAFDEAAMADDYQMLEELGSLYTKLILKDCMILTIG